MNESPKIHGIRRTSAADEVFKVLHEWIVTGQFKAGDHLPSQDKLAEQFHVSRNTLREAINKLVAMGLLAAKQGVGTVVQPTSPANYVSSLIEHVMLGPVTLREFVEARIFLERTLVRLAATRADAASLVGVRQALEAQKQALDQGDTAAFVEHDAAFHVALASASQNSVLAKYLQTTRDLLKRFIAAGAQEFRAIELDYERHTQIFQAVEAGDPREAERRMVVHLYEAVHAAAENLEVQLDVQTLFRDEVAA